jgi:hypothetical protein
MEAHMRFMRWPVRTLLISLGVLILGSAPRIRADEESDPPGRVARLDYFQGEVSFRPASVDDWTEADRNYPLTTGDHLWTDRDSRGELQIGGSVVRLGSETALSFLNLDDRTAQMRLAEGRIYVRVEHLEEDEVVEVDTPSAAVSLLQPGFYRIDVDPSADETAVTVRRGEAEVTSGGSAFPVRSQESGYVSGVESPTYDVRDARRGDGWEDWCEERDRREELSPSARYVSRQMIGYADLDEHGTWREDPEYGPVWVPSRVESDWAPYRSGHWAWVSPWGWTWVDDSPWGFAPFHYGRWANIRGTWAWCPGTRVARPMYAPALVAFVGGGSWSASMAIGDGMAWFALGPREVYVPPYAHSRHYLHDVNVTHVNAANINVNATNVTYANQRVQGAVTAVSRAEFVGGRSFGKTAVVVPVTAIRSAHVATSTQLATQVQPTRASVIAVRRGHVVTPPARIIDRPVVARLTPPAPPVHFAEPGKPRILETSKPNPLVHPLVPKVGQAVALRPARVGVPTAQPVAVHDLEMRRPTGKPSGNSLKPGTGTTQELAHRPSIEKNDRPTTTQPLEHDVRPTPRPTPTLEHELRPISRPTPTPEPHESFRPHHELDVRPTPRPTLVPTPRPTPREQWSEHEVLRPTPRPTPRPESQESFRSHHEETSRPTPRPTPAPELHESFRPRHEQEARPTPRPMPPPTPHPTPVPTPKPTPKK